MGCSVRDDSHPCAPVHKYHVQGGINHPAQHDMPVKLRLVDEKQEIHGHEDRDEIMEYIVVKRKMLIADVIEPMGLDRARTDNDMVHDGKRDQPRRHHIPAVRRVEEGEIRLEKNGAQPHHEKRERGERVILDTRPEHKRGQHPVFHQ